MKILKNSDNWVKKFPSGYFELRKLGMSKSSKVSGRGKCRCTSQETHMWKDFKGKYEDQ